MQISLRFEALADYQGPLGPPGSVGDVGEMFGHRADAEGRLRG
jgi:hypothetical protein